MNARAKALITVDNCKVWVGVKMGRVVAKSDECAPRAFAISTDYKTAAYNYLHGI